MSQVFCGWSHKSLYLVMCWCLDLDVLFSYADKIFRATRYTHGERIDWRQLIDACWLGLLDSPSIRICTPDSGNWIHNKCCAELHKPWMNTQLSLIILPLQHCLALLWGSEELQAFIQGCSRGTRRIQGDCRGRKAHSLHHRSALVTTGCSGPHSHRDTLPPCGNCSSSLRQLGKNTGRRLTTSLMLSGYTANAAATCTLVKQGAINLIY